MSDIIALANSIVVPRIQRLVVNQAAITHDDLICIIEDGVQHLTEMAASGAAGPAGLAARYLAGLVAGPPSA
jgi:hypothetical protein